jgi:hypothetical protein
MTRLLGNCGQTGVEFLLQFTRGVFGFRRLNSGCAANSAFNQPATRLQKVTS